jgi:hypothetical protein
MRWAEALREDASGPRADAGLLGRVWADAVRGTIGLMRSKYFCLVLLALFMAAGTACGEEGDAQRLPTSPAEEGGEEQEQEGGEEQEQEGGEEQEQEGSD